MTQSTLSWSESLRALHTGRLAPLQRQSQSRQLLCIVLLCSNALTAFTHPTQTDCVHFGFPVLVGEASLSLTHELLLSLSQWILLLHCCCEKSTYLLTSHCVLCGIHWHRHTELNISCQVNTAHDPGRSLNPILLSSLTDTLGGKKKACFVPSAILVINSIAGWSKEHTISVQMYLCRMLLYVQ